MHNVSCIFFDKCLNFSYYSWTALVFQCLTSYSKGFQFFTWLFAVLRSVDFCQIALKPVGVNLTPNTTDVNKICTAFPKHTFVLKLCMHIRDPKWENNLIIVSSTLEIECRSYWPIEGFLTVGYSGQDGPVVSTGRQGTKMNDLSLLWVLPTFVWLQIFSLHDCQYFVVLKTSASLSGVRCASQKSSQACLKISWWSCSAVRSSRSKTSIRCSRLLWTGCITTCRTGRRMWWRSWSRYASRCCLHRDSTSTSRVREMLCFTLVLLTDHDSCFILWLDEENRKTLSHSLTRL